MNFTIASVLAAACVLCVVHQVQCARILAIVPTPSYSHQIPFRRLWVELNRRGHEVVLVTANPIPNVNRTNFRQIDVSESYKFLRQIDFVGLRFERTSWLHFVEKELFDISDTFSENVLNNTEMRALYAPNSGQKFDVVMIEMLYMPAVYALVHRFDAPMIGITSLGILALNEHALGGIVLPSHEYTWEMEANTGSNLPFLKRLKNYVRFWYHLHIIYRELFPRQQQLAEKYFGPGVPSLLEILKNTSVLFVNQADVMTPARPKLANMVTFTSFHVDENPKPLPQDLKRFLDNSHNGFVYFSLGSNAMSSDMPKETIQVFIDVFAKLPYNVVWKFEKEMSGKPDNVFIGKWLPQQSILAHPNIKLFIYQGGLQSSEEAVHFSVPLLGLPVLADQDYQVLRMEALGVAKVLELTSVTREQLDTAIRELVTNKRYKQNMIELKNMMNDNPYDLVDHLVWWTEYVIRHKGAPHLRSNLAKQPWYQRTDMDIVVFLTIVIVIVLSKILNLVAKFLVHFYKQWDAVPMKQKIS